MFEFFSTIFNTVLYQPILNLLVWLYGVIGNFGWAIIALTLIVKIILNPLNQRALESQKTMMEMQPRIKELQNKFKNKEQQGRELLKLYQETKFNPFSGIFLLFLQLPVLWALFRVFQSGLDFEKTNGLLYSFISLPQAINPYFLTINLAEPSIFLAGITAVVQYLQTKTAALPQAESKDQAERVSQMVQKQTMLFIPAFTFFILFKLPAAIALYWSLTTVLNIIQQRKIFKKT
ncbi:MAG: YidC/Oxa1 family membrane protein insertase [Candidatus Paceibacterota bacterium]|jgi:YidC/Oxa1 family membrane protein insertase|nr:YidC/Oxa1 family membrane protein insertase [Candidatus Paceibacterota bacterium]MDD5555146.1 YidC/Oxa1 family membrane protein insertase [Candidatus Paceibacterota bacterium]